MVVKTSGTRPAPDYSHFEYRGRHERILEGPHQSAAISDWSGSALFRCFFPEQLDESLKLISRGVGDRKIGDAALAPRQGEESALVIASRRCSRSLPPRDLGEADEGLAAQIDEGGESAEPPHIDPCPDQGKAFAAEVRHDRREGELAIEPRLDRV